MILTHGLGDHVGGVGPFPEVWIAPADEPMLRNSQRRYKGEVKHLTDGETIDLGGRKLEVMFTPGHTSGSVTFFDKANHYGFSGDAFGSTNLLVFTYLSNVKASAQKVEQYMKDNDIRFLWCSISNIFLPMYDAFTSRATLCSSRRCCRRSSS